MAAVSTAFKASWTATASFFTRKAPAGEGTARPKKVEKTSLAGQEMELTELPPRALLNRSGSAHSTDGDGDSSTTSTEPQEQSA